MTEKTINLATAADLVDFVEEHGGSMSGEKRAHFLSLISDYTGRLIDESARLAVVETHMHAHHNCRWPDEGCEYL